MSWKLINNFIGRGIKQNIIKNTKLHEDTELNVTSDLFIKLRNQQN